MAWGCKYRLSAVRVMFPTDDGSNFPNFPNFPGTRPRDESGQFDSCHAVPVELPEPRNFLGTSGSTRRRTHDSRLRPQIHEPGRAAGFVREEGGACAALHGLWERASFSTGAMLSAWLTSGSGARIHHVVARATSLTCFPVPDLSVRVGARRCDPDTARSSAPAAARGRRSRP